jgi:D-glycero-D-manno-heptose 1,7-bisphosphate phosphatase
VVTNQPDVARGATSREAVEQLNALLARQVGLDTVRVCFHDDADHCPCRKPKPGLLTAAADDYGIDLAQSWMVGDRWRDIDAGHAAGCRTVLIDYGYDERHPPRPPEARTADLAGAAGFILAALAGDGASSGGSTRSSR